jgi:hypothetical protein
MDAATAAVLADAAFDAVGEVTRFFDAVVSRDNRIFSPKRRATSGDEPRPCSPRERRSRARRYVAPGSQEILGPSSSPYQDDGARSVKPTPLAAEWRHRDPL